MLLQEAIAILTGQAKELMDGIMVADAEAQKRQAMIYREKIEVALETLAEQAEERAKEDDKERTVSYERWCRNLRTLSKSEELEKVTSQSIFSYTTSLELYTQSIKDLETKHIREAANHYYHCFGIYMERRTRTDESLSTSVSQVLSHSIECFQITCRDSPPEELADALAKQMDQNEKFAASYYTANMQGNDEIIAELEKMKMPDDTSIII